MEDQQPITSDQLPPSEVALSEPVPTHPGGGRRRRSLAWAVGLGLTAAVVGLAAQQLAKTGGSASELARAYGFTIGYFSAQAERESRPAPDLVARDLDGEPIALRDYRGKVVVLNMWASWCGPCRREQPVLVKLAREYAERNVQFLGLNVRDPLAGARSFRDEFEVPYPSFVDEDSRLAFQMQAQVLPTTWIIDARGNIFFRFTGTIDEVLVRNGIDAAMRGEGATSDG